MCGIAGVLALNGGNDVTALVERLTTAHTHRGPDGAGYRFFNGRSIAFGHRRLSIVDLEHGAQPMANEDGTIWIVFNGELYNHLDLRRELENLGHEFRTHSDVEAVVHGWEAWGPAVLDRMNGMYAFALYDGRDRLGRSGTIWLARDPVGIKPLYVGKVDDLWWFASELTAARQCRLLSDEMQSDALTEYLVYRFIPSPRTLYRSVWKLPPGHYCRIQPDDTGTVPEFTRFTPRFSPSIIPSNRHEWEEGLRSAIGAAVKRQLMADVPLGVLLSGGVDSTVVGRLVRDQTDEIPLAFGVGVEGVAGENELPAARRAASALTIPLSELVVTREEVLASWPNQIRALGEPVANSGAVLIGLLCRQVRQHRKVVLTGQGADEPLGGYARHAAERWSPWARAMGPFLNWIPESVVGSDQLSRIKRIAWQSTEARRFTEILAVFSPDEAVKLSRASVDADALVDPVRRWLPDGGGEPDSTNRLLTVDRCLSLADDLLLVADHTSMASSVELRVPFLDLGLLAFVEQMPSRYKVSPMGERKWLYRRAVASWIPRSLRPSLLGWRARVGKKFGFNTPLNEWLQRWSRSTAESYLLGKDALLPAFLNPGAIRALLNQVGAEGRLRPRQLISLYVLETWLRGAISGSREAVSA